MCIRDRFQAPRAELQRLYDAMRYSVMNGGKRVRPLLVYAACEALDGDLERADGAACAVELIHAYSLVHDDLPAMDDDDPVSYTHLDVYKRQPSYSRFQV